MNTSDDETARRYPLPSSFRLRYLKELIKRIECSHNVVNESIYNDYIDLLNEKAIDEFHHVTYTVCDRVFTFKQSDKLVTDGTTGLKSYDAGLQLFEQIYANKERIFKNKRLLELGSGCGLTGILISALCEVENYTFTDHHDRVLELIKDNLKINGFSLSKDLDKKSNKFYEYEDDEGNVSAKYYANDDTTGEFSSNSFKSGSMNGFGGSSSFVRQGPLHLESSTEKNEFDFRNEFSLNDKTADIFSYSNDKATDQLNNDDDKLFGKKSDDIFKVDMDEKLKNFDYQRKKIEEKMISFEELLKSFEEKLSLSENVNKQHRTVHRPTNLRNKDKDVNVAELDWFSSDGEIIDQLNKYKPDYVIGSDIVYDPSIIPDLLRVFKLCLSTLDCGLIIVCAIRNEDTIKQFEQQLRQFQKAEDGIKIQRNKLSAKLTYFDNVELSDTKFVLYNIQNEDEDDEH